MPDRRPGVFQTLRRSGYSLGKRLVQFVLKIPQFLLIFAVRCYQKGISPWLGSNCRFHPTCSQYFVLAVEKYGVIRGAFKGVGRICRCHPWHSGGEDWP